ncbi:MAG: endolytic transglycosylase MltG [Comamonas sp.]
MMRDPLHGGVRVVKRILLMIIVAALAVAASGYWWLHQPIVAGDQPVELEIEPGTAPRAVAHAVQAAGMQVNPDLLYWWFRLSGQDRKIRAGNYEIPAGTTPTSLLARLVRGEDSQRVLTIVEGWNFRQVRAALAKEENLKHDSADMTPEQIMDALGRPGVAAEGRFFPDTYAFSKGSSELALLKRAMQAMDKRLDIVWSLKGSDNPLKTPEDLLTLASIVEKETGKAADRSLVAGVFINRLRIGMLLQTDPTVIYGLGEKFDGNLRRRDLQTDTPWNTYTRAGLPPTPIAMPGKASLMAAVQPEKTKALYFVAKGDGSSHFSESLDEHNRAVNQYQRGK